MWDCIHGEPIYWIVRTTIVTNGILLLMLNVALRIGLLLLLGMGLAQAQGVRDRTRPDNFSRDTTVSAVQALELTLTLVQTAPQALQTWVRTAATIDDTGRILTATLCSSDAELVQLAQRVRAFPPDSKSSIYQARITGITPQGDCVNVEATLARSTFEKSAFYVMEIVVQRGKFLAIPSEAIIEEGDRQIVYVSMDMDMSQGADRMQTHYRPQEIHTGLQGELYTQILSGLSEGDQVVTLGSFFIDADYKLKSTEQATMSDAHIHH